MRDTIGHAAGPGNYAPAMFVVRNIDTGRIDVYRQAGLDVAPEQYSGPYATMELAARAIQGAKRAAAMCCYCYGSCSGAVCPDCGMKQHR